MKFALAATASVVIAALGSSCSKEADTESTEKTPGEVVTEKGTEAAEKAGKMVDDANQAIDESVDKAGEMADDAKKAVDETMDKAGEMADDAKNSVLKGAEDLGDKMQENADKVEEMMNE